MLTDINTPMNKNSEISSSTDDSYPFSKSLRYITLKWLNKESKSGKKEQKSLSKSSSEYDACVAIDSEKSADNENNKDEKYSHNYTCFKDKEDVAADQTTLEFFIPDSGFNIENSTLKEKCHDPTIISLHVDNELRSSSDAQDSSSSYKSRRKKAFDSIKNYLDKNKSSQSFLSKRKLEKKQNTSTTLESKTSSSNFQTKIFTGFEDKTEEKNTNSESSDMSSIMNTTDTCIQEPKNLFDLFNYNRPTPKNYDLSVALQSSNQFTESEVSSEIVTIVKNVTENLESNNVKRPEKFIEENTAESLNFRQDNQQAPMFSLYVGDLSNSVSETDLQNCFSPFEGFLSVRIPMDTSNKKSLQYGYVNFNNQKNAEIATEALNYSNLKGSEIRIMPSIRDKIERDNLGANIFFFNLSSELSSRVIYDRLKPYGKILSCKYSSEKCTCFVSFENKLEAYRVCKNLNRTEMDGKIIGVSIHIAKKDREKFQKRFAGKPKNNLITYQKTEESFLTEKNKNENNLHHKKLQEVEPNKVVVNEKALSTQYSVFIKNLPLNLNDNVIKNLVEPYGTVKNILSRNVPEKNGSWALITMTNKGAIDRTIKSLNTVEIEGKKLYVTRAIPREEKEYAKREELQPKKKLKLLVSNINLESDAKSLEKLCKECESIKAAEFFGSRDKIATDSKKTSGYGYIEINDENDAENLIEQIKSLGVSCYKIKIELPSSELDSESSRYPYVINKRRFGARNISFSYVDPGKLIQIASFKKAVDDDKINNYQKMENFNKIKFKNMHALELEDEYDLLEKQNEMCRAIWEISVRLFQHDTNGSHSVEFLNKAKVSSLTNHLVKFFWANNFKQFYNFMKVNQFDSSDRVIYKPNPILSVQLYQSAFYLGIIPKPLS